MNHDGNVIGIAERRRERSIRHIGFAIALI
jgi:hypothetical protein